MPVTTTSQPHSSTGIGIALAKAVAVLRESEAKSRIVILLTDGENALLVETGNPEVIAGALQRASEQDVPSCINVLTDTTAVSPGTVGLTMLFAQSLQDFQKA